MPPRMEVIQTKPITLTFDATEWRGAFIAARASTRERSWQRRIDDAERLQPKTLIQWYLNACLITSPRSGYTYEVTPGKCGCIAWVQQQQPCWHRVLPRLIRRIWARSNPQWQCPYCCGPLIDTHTPGGERVCNCLVCDYAIPFQFHAELSIWPNNLTLTIPERISAARKVVAA